MSTPPAANDTPYVLTSIAIERARLLQLAKDQKTLQIQAQLQRAHRIAELTKAYADRRAVPTPHLI